MSTELKWKIGDMKVDVLTKSTWNTVGTAQTCSRRSWVSVVNVHCLKLMLILKFNSGLCVFFFLPFSLGGARSAYLLLWISVSKRCFEMKWYSTPSVSWFLLARLVSEREERRGDERRQEERLRLPQTQTVWLTVGAESIWSEPLINIAGSLKHGMWAVPTLVYIIV